jgi:hypothetical protein
VSIAISATCPPYPARKCSGGWSRQYDDAVEGRYALDGQLGRPLFHALRGAELVSRERLGVIGRHLASLPPDGFEDPAVIAETYRLYGETVRGVSCHAFDALLRRVWDDQPDDLFGFVRPLVADLCGRFRPDAVLRRHP